MHAKEKRETNLFEKEKHNLSKSRPGSYFYVYLIL